MVMVVLVLVIVLCVLMWMWGGIVVDVFGFEIVMNIGCLRWMIFEVVLLEL